MRVASARQDGRGDAASAVVLRDGCAAAAVDAPPAGQLAALPSVRPDCRRACGASVAAAAAPRPPLASLAFVDEGAGVAASSPGITLPTGAVASPSLDADPERDDGGDDDAAVDVAAALSRAHEPSGGVAVTRAAEGGRSVGVCVGAPVGGEFRLVLLSRRRSAPPAEASGGAVGAVGATREGVAPWGARCTPCALRISSISCCCSLRCVAIALAVAVSTA